jgi:hypothetical protein
MSSPIENQRKELLKRKVELQTGIKRSKITLAAEIEELHAVKKRISSIEDDIKQDEIIIKNINKTLGIKE